MQIGISTLVEIRECNNLSAFVETGTYSGDGLKNAIEAGFTRLWSCDIGESFVRDAIAKFPQARILHGDSAVCLRQIMSEVNGPAFIWLDAHGYFDGATVNSRPICPVLSELAVLSETEQDARRRGHRPSVIAVDDIRLFRDKTFAQSVQTVQSAIIAIDPRYRFRFVEGHYPDDILVAEIFDTL